MFPKEGTFVKRKLMQYKGEYIVFKIEEYQDNPNNDYNKRLAYGKTVFVNIKEKNYIDVQDTIDNLKNMTTIWIYSEYYWEKNKRRRDKYLDSGEAFCEVL